MDSAIDQFKENVARVRSILALRGAISNQIMPIIDLTDLLRISHVMIVSALDHYVHEIVRSHMMSIFDGSRPVAAAYGRFKPSMHCLHGTVVLSDARDNIEAEIRYQHSFQSFQQPDKIADAIRFVSDVKLWEEVGKSLGEDPKLIKSQLALIVDRRNKIAHEADLDPTYPNTRWPIAPEDVENSVDFVERVVQSIDAIIA